MEIVVRRGQRFIHRFQRPFEICRVAKGAQSVPRRLEERLALAERILRGGFAVFPFLSLPFRCHIPLLLLSGSSFRSRQRLLLRIRQHRQSRVVRIGCGQAFPLPRRARTTERQGDPVLATRFCRTSASRLKITRFVEPDLRRILVRPRHGGKQCSRLRFPDVRHARQIALAESNDARVRPQSERLRRYRTEIGKRHLTPTPSPPRRGSGSA